MAIYGTGEFVKSLWIYGPSGEWIPVPLGAGQDDYLRSLNVWDGEKWWVPTWAPSEHRRLDLLPGPGLVPSLEVRDTQDTRAILTNIIRDEFALGSALFPDGRDFPFNDPYNPFFTKWRRLFHMRPRPNPEWRILRIGPSYPAWVPNRQLRWRGPALDITSFRGAMGISQWSGPSPDNQALVHDFFGYPKQTAWLGLAGFTENQQYDERDYADQVTASVTKSVSNSALFTAGTPSYSYTTSLIDFHAIRERLTTYYREQGVDYIGQYDPIELMGIRRIYIRGQISAFIWSRSDHPIDTATMSGANLALYAASGSPGVTFSRDLPTLSFTPEYPDRWETGVTVRRTDGYSPGGSIVWQKTSPSTFTETTSTNNGSYREPPGNSATLAQYVEHNKYLNYSEDITVAIENPGNDNLTLTAMITGAALAEGPISPPIERADLDDEIYVVGTALTQMQFRISDIAIHWAYPGVDTPTGLHHWDAWG